MAVLAAAFAAHLAAAVLSSVPLLVAASAVGLLADLHLHLRHPALTGLLTRVRLDVTARQLLRDLLTITTLLRVDGVHGTRAYAPVLVGLLALYAAHSACHALALLVRRARTLPVVTRNIDATPLNPTPAPPLLLARRPGHRLLLLSLSVSAGLLTTAVTGDALWAALGAASAAVAAVGGAAYLALWLLPARRPVDGARALQWLDRWLADYRPTVGIYFSGGAASAYQLNMWLSTLARLDGRPVVVLRERPMVQRVEATDIPVLCIPKVADVMRLEHSTLKVLLHPSNSGKTSQILRIPTIKHAFTNHGESDKLSSCNPYAKAYDEVWVAGPAARERYALADIGVDDRDVVEVGRPQLAPILPGSAAPAGPMTTVLYAPTWEGWDGQPGNTSVVLAGENIVRALLADPAVRLLYKPHPLTGSVDPRAGRADRRIRAMITEACRERARTAAGGAPTASSTELARRAAALDELTTARFRAAADDVERMALQGTPAAGRAAAVEAATAAWEDCYWSAAPAWEHRVITDSRPSLYSCFNQADLLISDVSSVVSDFLASEKPHAVANTSGLAEDAFRTAFPTVAAATIISPDAHEVPALLDSVRDPERDGLGPARAALKERLLGPARPTSLERFKAAARALAAAADERRSRQEVGGTPAVARVVAPREAGQGGGAANEPRPQARSAGR
ncbi:hypothetical protein PV392_19200 [Streptomyces sp. ME03-5709C]|nr:hypothetical protein [Streptomyces sp. ME03-5709C]